jgi:hypothetical protein
MQEEDHVAAATRGDTGPWGHHECRQSPLPACPRCVCSDYGSSVALIGGGSRFHYISHILEKHQQQEEERPANNNSQVSHDGPRGWQLNSVVNLVSEVCTILLG